MAGTVNNPATFSSVRTAFSGFNNQGAPTNLGGMNKGTAYVPLGPTFDGIPETSAGVRLSQFNGLKYPPASGGLTTPGCVISTAVVPLYDKFSIYAYQYGYYRSSFGAITTESLFWQIITGKYNYDLTYTLRGMYFYRDIYSTNGTMYMTIDGDVRTLAGTLRVGRHSFSWSGGGSYYNGGTGNQYTTWSFALPSNPFNEDGTLAEVKRIT